MTEKSFKMLGLELLSKRDGSTMAVFCSGQSKWHPRRDIDDTLFGFIDEAFGDLDESVKSEIHIEHLTFANSSTIGLLSDLVGKILRSGAAVGLYFDPDIPFQYKLERAFHRILDPGMKDRFVATNAKEGESV